MDSTEPVVSAISINTCEPSLADGCPTPQPAPSPDSLVSVEAFKPPSALPLVSSIDSLVSVETFKPPSAVASPPPASPSDSLVSVETFEPPSADASLTPPLPSSPDDLVSVQVISLDLPVEIRTLPKFEKPLEVKVREARLLDTSPWVRSLGNLEMKVSTFGWKFPTPAEPVPAKPRLHRPETEPESPPVPSVLSAFFPTEKEVRLRPTNDTIVFKDRLLFLLQPSLNDVFRNKQVTLPFQPYPYQLQGIAFLMPRHAALIADEMGLEKRPRSSSP